MADDNQQTTPPQTQAPAQQAPPPPAPERREDDAPKFGRRQADRPESCPRCGVHVERGKLGSHNFHAHGEDRRAKDRTDDGDKDKDKDKDGPKAPPKKDDKGSQSGGQGQNGTGTRRKPKGRWGDVRKGWG
jgi:hypothetical protein